MKTYLFFLSLIFASTLNIVANTFTVTNTNDAGTGSLREAITYANFMAGTHTINFNIPLTDANYSATTGVFTIKPASILPYITRSNITIDGTSQATNKGDTNPLGPEIFLDGNNNTIDNGFSIINVSGVTIKGFIISNFLYGIQIYGTSASGNFIKGNYIGVNYNASDTAGNYIGIEIIGGATNNTVGGTTASDRNIVSGNEHIGIRAVDANSNIIIGNYVGTDRTGTFALGNYDGVSVEGTAKYNRVGGTTTGEGNLVSGNVAYGVPIFGAGCNENIVIGNLIGTDVTGTQSIPNTYGLLFDDGATNNTVGGYTVAERNILSGNSGYGVFLYNLGTNSNKVIGNYIGTDITGIIAVPNANGIVIDGAAKTHLIDSNLISGNLQQGIVIHITGSDSHIITRNFIGTDHTGLNPLGNGFDGIRIAEGPKNNIIGGTPEEANIIAYNGGNGVTIMNDDDDFNKISCNSIHNNAGMGIDLFPPGINPNDTDDSDTGPNQGMNYPIINMVCVNPPYIDGFLNTNSPEKCTIQIYKSDTLEGFFGEGIEYLGSVSPQNTGYWLLDNINISFNDVITAIAIDSLGNTSEFSENANVDICMNIANNKNKKNNFNIYPNPLQNQINFDFSVQSNSLVEIKVYTLDGKFIKTLFSEILSEGKYSKSFPNSLAKNNAYMLVLEADGVKSAYKVVLSE
ncbi:MAG: hypothetical protein A2033_18390 [Bacteroidetes bacterium GWA2_31_9]|nr:MAG: hypothetical protein A2033_18390 [Bacteroidetes bacterium GWA2_31_9]